MTANTSTPSAIGRNADSSLTLEELLRRSEVAVVGLDGGGLDDLLGMAVIGREKPVDEQSRKFYTGAPIAQRWLHWGHAWAWESVLQRRKEIMPRLLDFAADGDLTIIDRIGDDVIGVADYIEQIRDAGLFPEARAIGVDQAGIGAIVDELAGRGFSVSSNAAAGMIDGIPQGWKLMNAIKTVERKLAGGEMVHGGSRLMAWCVGNAKVEPKGNAIVITKQAAGTAKIDPLMALFNAAALMALNPEGGVTVYEREDRGFLVL
jgi:phage terminase large subunit-like protein